MLCSGKATVGARVSNAGAESRPDFTFLAGHPALDLCATLAGRLKPQPRELLASPEDVSRWLVQAELAEAPPPVSAADLERARLLRESVYALALARVHGERAPAPARRQLNAIAAARSAVPQLTVGGRLRVTGNARDFLAGLARSAVRLLGSDKAASIRQCEAQTCARLFIDASRSGERRWCSMSGCGNKAKVAQFRRRQQQR